MADYATEWTKMERPTHKLMGRAMNVAVFESIHSQADCGDLFMRWIM